MVISIFFLASNLLITEDVVIQTIKLNFISYIKELIIDTIQAVCLINKLFNILCSFVQIK